jgi:glucosamine--fructose-6-phosphate aminotransferase (isomerizing)
MCGIFSIVSFKRDENISCELIDGLKLMEYRGYDSAGMAILTDSNQYNLTGGNLDYELNTVKAIGEINNLKSAYYDVPLSGYIGIAHTRWATHGSVSIKNTHPIIVGDIAIVHNGTVENYLELRQLLHEKHGYIVSSETDTEVIAALIHYEVLDCNDLFKAVQTISSKLIGKLAFVVMSKLNPELLISGSFGRQLVIGISSEKNFIASDIVAFPQSVESLVYLDDGDIAVVGGNYFDLYNLYGQKLERSIEKYNYTEYKDIYNHYKTFMYKEISEQHEVIGNILKNIESDIENATQNSAILSTISKIDLAQYKKIHIIGCGAAYYAGYVGQYLIERGCSIPTFINIASEFAMRQPVIDNETLYICISQSGETADTIAAMEYIASYGGTSLAITNRLHSPIGRRCNFAIPIEAGVEQSVAATKTFTAQILIFQILVAQFKGYKFLAEAIKDCDTSKLKLNDDLENEIINAMREITSANRILYIGRDILYPICLEGALKIKEIGYVAAEGIAAGEIKHGPIALVDEYTPVIILAPYSQGEIFTKILSNIHEIKARKGKIIIITCQKGKEILSQMEIKQFIVMPDVSDMLLPIAYSIPLQLLAYNYALNMGYNIDKPRNLAKAVTVE